MDQRESVVPQTGADSTEPLDDESLVYLRGMERLLQAVLDLASATTLDDIAEIVRHAARDLSQADGATFVLRDGGSCFYMQEDAIEPLWRGMRFPMEDCISGWAMLHKQDVSISNIYLDDRIPHEAYRPTFVKSLAISPIRTTDPIGAIGSYWATEHAATHAERHLLQALADSTALALENVRMRNDLERRVAARTIQLATANEDLQQFASRAAHDLREPISTITGFAQLLRDEVSSSSELVTQAVDGIERTGKRMLTLIDGLLNFARSGSRERVTETVDLDELLQGVLAELAQRIHDSGAVVLVERLGTIEADWMLIGQALQNLVANALTYVRDDAVPRVRVEAERCEGKIVIRVVDNGPGVPIEDRERIRRPFARGNAGSGIAGTGLGLAICQRVAEHHGGVLLIDDAPGGGSVFALQLPDNPV